MGNGGESWVLLVDSEWLQGVRYKMVRSRSKKKENDGHTADVISVRTRLSCRREGRKE